MKIDFPKYLHNLRPSNNFGSIIEKSLMLIKLTRRFTGYQPTWVRNFFKDFMEYSVVSFFPPHKRHKMQSLKIDFQKKYFQSKKRHKNKLLNKICLLTPMLLALKILVQSLYQPPNTSADFLSFTLRSISSNCLIPKIFSKIL